MLYCYGWMIDKIERSLRVNLSSRKISASSNSNRLVIRDLSIELISCTINKVLPRGDQASRRFLSDLNYEFIGIFSNEF